MASQDYVTSVDPEPYAEMCEEFADAFTLIEGLFDEAPLAFPAPQESNNE